MFLYLKCVSLLEIQGLNTKFYRNCHYNNSYVLILQQYIENIDFWYTWVMSDFYNCNNNFGIK